MRKHIVSLCLGATLAVAHAETPDIILVSEGAEKMLAAIAALHDNSNPKMVETLVDAALATDAYKLSAQRYGDPSRPRENRVEVEEFRAFLLSLRQRAPLTAGKPRLEMQLPRFQDAVEHPQKYREALRTISTSSETTMAEALKLAHEWLPPDTKIRATVWLVLDMGGSYPWVYAKGSNDLHVGVDVLQSLDENGKFPQDVFTAFLAHEFHHLGYSLDAFKALIGYASLPAAHPLRLYTDYMNMLLGEGMAMKFCNNAPGVLSNSPYPAKPFLTTAASRQVWETFAAEAEKMHAHAVSDMERVVGLKPQNLDSLGQEMREYWAIPPNSATTGRPMVHSRNYFWGGEMLGVIHDAFGKKAVAEAMADFRRIPPLYNLAVEKLGKPKKWSFPKAVVDAVATLQPPPPSRTP